MKHPQCPHPDFTARVEVARLEDSGRFMADVTVNCSACGVPMLFRGLEVGCKPDGAMVSVDGREARLAIAPEGTVPSALDVIDYKLHGEKHDA